MSMKSKKAKSLEEAASVITDAANVAPPSKHEKEIRKQKVVLYLTETERELLREAAQKDGLPEAVFARRRALKDL